MDRLQPSSAQKSIVWKTLKPLTNPQKSMLERRPGGDLAPRCGIFWEVSLTQPTTMGYFGKFLFPSERVRFLKRFPETCAPPKGRPTNKTEIFPPGPTRIPS